MSSSESNGVMSEKARVLLISVVIGTILLLIFNSAFPSVSTTEVLTVIGLASLMIGLVINAIMKRRKAGGKKDETVS